MHLNMLLVNDCNYLKTCSPSGNSPSVSSCGSEISTVYQNMCNDSHTHEIPVLVQVIQLLEAGHTLGSTVAALLRQLSFVPLCLGSL